MRIHATNNAQTVTMNILESILTAFVSHAKTIVYSVLMSQFAYLASQIIS